MEDQAPKHKLKLIVNVEATGGLHASKAVLEAVGKAINSASGEIAGLGGVELVAESVHVSERKARKVAAPESQPEAESK